MRLTREKSIRLSHIITDLLVASNDVEFVEDRDTIRQQVVAILTATLREEEKADAEVRKKITSQKKEILEGSEEWDVLYRKYYVDELYAKLFVKPLIDGSTSILWQGVDRKIIDDTVNHAAHGARHVSDEVRHMQQRGDRPDERQFQALAALDSERKALEQRIAEAALALHCGKCLTRSG